MSKDINPCRHDSYKEYEVDGLGKDVGKKVTLYICDDCGLMSKNKCEVWSRVVGYLRPVDGYNPGKKQEFEERKTYKNTK